MPELPEVETIARGLRALLGGKTIRSCLCRCPRIVEGDSLAFSRAVVGRKIEGIQRHGKYLFFLLSGPLTVSLHLRMTGQILMAGPDLRPDKHTHLEFFFAGTEEKRLIYRDVRKFGRFQLLESGGWAEFVARKGLGPDALGVRLKQVEARFRQSRRALKALLLDQTVLAGLGNIYTDESLFRAGLLPQQRAERLRSGQIRFLLATVRQVLRAALAKRGTTISDFVDANGDRGRFQPELLVYGRQGKPCRKCGRPILRALVAGRGTFYCPACQSQADG